MKGENHTMKRYAFLAIAALALSASGANVQTNFVGSLATRQFVMKALAPEADFVWTYEIVQDVDGSGSSSYYWGEPCTNRIAQWLSASTTNVTSTSVNAPVQVNGNAGKLTLKETGFSLGALDTYHQDSSDPRYTARITLSEAVTGFDGILLKWNFYKTNAYGERREFNIQLEVRPRWRFERPASS